MKELKEKLIEIFEKNLEGGLSVSATQHTLNRQAYNCNYVIIDNDKTVGIFQNIKDNNDNLIYFQSKERVTEPLSYGQYNRLLKLHCSQRSKRCDERQEKEKVEREKNYLQTLKDINKLCK